MQPSRRSAVCVELGLSGCNEACGRKEVDATSVQRHAAAKVVDHVIVPGDYAETEYVDSGPGIVRNM